MKFIVPINDPRIEEYFSTLTEENYRTHPFFKNHLKPFSNDFGFHDFCSRLYVFLLDFYKLQDFKNSIVSPPLSPTLIENCIMSVRSLQKIILLVNHL